MKHPKPAFKVYLQTRLKHPFMSKETLIYVNASGERFRDTGSEITQAVIMSLWGIFFFSSITFSVRVWGIFLWIIVPVLHHYLRYFWTDFAKLDDEGKSIEAEGKVRYKSWQRALIVLIPIILMSSVYWAGMLLQGTPYVRHYYDPDEYKKIGISQPVEDLVQAYDEAHRYIIGRIPEAELVGYSINLNKADTEYNFSFRNPERGIFMRDSIEMANIRLLINGECITCDFSDITPSEAGLKAVAAPAAGLDFTRLCEIVRQEAGVKESDVDEIKIEPELHNHVSKYNYDPGGKTWSVTVRLGGYEIYFTVDIEKGIAVRESDNIR